MTKLSFIILSFNTTVLTQKCLNSLVQYYKSELEKTEFEILLVDNNSSDTTVEDIKKLRYPSITIIENKENVGFARGCNNGADHAKGNILLFLNSDTTFQDNNVHGMLNYLEEHKAVGVLGGRLQNPNKTYQASAGVFYTLSRIILLLLGGERIGQLRFSPNKITHVDWVSGAMLMIKKEFFDKVGKFDKNIFMYMEDMELCYRVKKFGEDVVYYPLCTIQHISHASSNRSFAIVQIYKGILYFYKKHKSKMEYTIVWILLIIKAYILIFVGTILGKSSLKQTYAQAAKEII